MSLILTEKLVLFGIHLNPPAFYRSNFSYSWISAYFNWIAARIYSHNHLGEKDEYLEKLYRYFTLEKGIFAGAISFLLDSSFTCMF